MADNIGYLLIKLGRSIERSLQRQLEGCPVGASQLIALTHIAQNPGVSRAALARAIAVSPQAAGLLAAQLHDNGFVVRTDFHAGQPTRHAVTADGMRVLATATPAIRALVTDLAERVPPPHRDLLARIVRNLSCTYREK